MEQMGNLEMWNFLVGFFLPLALSVIIQSSFSQAVQAILSFAAATVASVGTVALTHGLHFDEHLVTSVLLIFVTSVATYKNFWKPTGVAPALEAKTNLSGADRV